MIDIPSAELVLKHCICMVSYIVHFSFDFFV